MPTPIMTEAEIISYLARTSLPTVLVEGQTDASIYRWLENQLGILTGSVLFCSGRNVLLSIYKRRNEFPHGKLAWLADLDMWKYSSPPADLSGIIFTRGYSIENDLYAGSDIEALMEAAERNQHTRLLDAVCRWFAFAIIEHAAGRPIALATHINRIVDFGSMDIHPQFLSTQSYTEPPTAMVEQIRSDYKLNLRTAKHYSSA